MTWWQKRRLKHGKKDVFVGEREEKYCVEGAKSAFRLLSTSLKLSKKGTNPQRKETEKKSKKSKSKISAWFRPSKVSAFFGFRGFWETPIIYYILCILYYRYRSPYLVDGLQ